MWAAAEARHKNVKFNIKSGLERTAAMRRTGARSRLRMNMVWGK